MSAMANVIIIGVVCPYCQKFRSAHEIIVQPGGVRICLECEQRHIEALAAFGTGIFHGECSECGEASSEQNRTMVVHYENGKYRVVCMKCDPAYVRKRKDLYGGTEYWRSLGLT